MDKELPNKSSEKFNKASILARIIAVTGIAFTGACDELGNPLPPKNSETAAVEPNIQKTETQFDSPLAPAHLASAEPSNQDTYLPYVEKEEQQKILIFSNDPASQEGQQIGDGGFRTQCNFGATQCARDEKILSGPYLRNFDQPKMQELGLDDSTLEITIEGTGFAKVGATDARMTNSSFGFHEANVQLPYTFRIYWPGLGEKDGYGLEITAENVIDSNQPQAHITNVRIEKVADGDILSEKPEANLSTNEVIVGATSDNPDEQAAFQDLQNRLNATKIQG